MSIRTLDIRSFSPLDPVGFRQIPLQDDSERVDEQKEGCKITVENKTCY